MVFKSTVKSREDQRKRALVVVPSDVPYAERDGCTYALFHDHDGNAVEHKIAGFTARITREIAKHEGREVRKYFEVVATHHDGTQAGAVIKASDFEAMSWVASELGSKFAVEPGRGTRDQMRHACRFLRIGTKSTG